MSSDRRQIFLDVNGILILETSCEKKSECLYMWTVRRGRANGRSYIAQMSSDRRLFVSAIKRVNSLVYI